jgi:hypothetical protein
VARALSCFCPEGVGGRLADDLLRSGSKIRRPGKIRHTASIGLTAGSRQIVGKPASHALRAEACRDHAHALRAEASRDHAHALRAEASRDHATPCGPNRVVIVPTLCVGMNPVTLRVTHIPLIFPRCIRFIGTTCLCASCLLIRMLRNEC